MTVDFPVMVENIYHSKLWDFPAVCTKGQIKIPIYFHIQAIIGSDYQVPPDLPYHKSRSPTYDYPFQGTEKTFEVLARPGVASAPLQPSGNIAACEKLPYHITVFPNCKLICGRVP